MKLTACLALALSTCGACTAYVSPSAPGAAVAKQAAHDIPCTTEPPVVVASTDNEAADMYRVVAVEGCGQRLTYMVRDDGGSVILVGRVPRQ